jgi:DNA-binding MarR family transcriptional regulator
MVKTGKQGKRRETASGLAASPSHLMHRALQLALDIYAEETAGDGLTQRQFAVLEAVAGKAGLSQTELVKATGIDRSTLADLVARMTTKGLLERERSTLDARAKSVRLSAQGQAALETARPRVEAADRRIMGLLPKGDRDRFLAILSELSAAADAAPEAAKAEVKAAKKAQKDARKAEKAAKKASKKPDERPARAKDKKKAKPAKAPADLVPEDA